MSSDITLRQLWEALNGERYDAMTHAEALIRSHGVCALYKKNFVDCFVRRMTGYRCDDCTTTEAHDQAERLLRSKVEVYYDPETEVPCKCVDESARKTTIKSIW